MTGEELRLTADEGLVAGVLEGREPDLCFEELVRRHHELVFRFIRKHVSNVEDARDVEQQTWLRVFERLGRYVPGRARLTTWACRIAYGFCQHYWRSRRRERAKLERYARHCACEREADPMRRTVLSHELWHFLKQLPLLERSLIVRHRIDGRTIDDLARTWGIKTGKVRYKLMHAMASMQETARAEGHRALTGGRAA